MMWLRGKVLEITRQMSSLSTLKTMKISMCVIFLGGISIEVSTFEWKRPWLIMEHVYVKKKILEIIKIMHFLFYFNLYIFQFCVFLIKKSCQFLCLQCLLDYVKTFWGKCFANCSSENSSNVVDVGESWAVNSVIFNEKRGDISNMIICYLFMVDRCKVEVFRFNILKRRCSWNPVRNRKQLHMLAIRWTFLQIVKFKFNC